MAGAKEPDDGKELQQRGNDCCFVWDETTQLFFHASTGFYHDPNAGWYYSSRDGLYYKFENGNFVLLESHKANEGEVSPCDGTATDNAIDDEQGHTECNSNQTPENPPPPSAWLEETLIDLYLSGYNGAVSTDSGAMETAEQDNFQFSANENINSLELEEGEIIPEDHQGLIHSSEQLSEEGVSWEEDNWRSQYGQVIQPEEEQTLGFQVVELWDWSMVTECRKDGNDQVAKLVGHLVRRSAKLHPSMPSGGGLLKTAPICEVHLDLVRVTTGQVYKLRSPGAKYLASLSSYDSSNPTKDWGYPEFFPLSKSTQKCKLELYDGSTDSKDTSTLPDQSSSFEKHRSHAYRDRAAERRTLHGGFGLGPGQKSLVLSDDGGDLSPQSTRAEDAAAEALEMSFGTGSYARRILESMGWKEGEALGNTTKGLLKPLEPIANVGSSGLGWPRGRTLHL